MRKVPVSEWKRVPREARIQGISLGNIKRDADTPLKALAEFCNCARVISGLRFKEVVRSGRFKNWLSVSALHLISPLKCCEGVYIAASNDRSGNFTRLTLLASELRLLDRCFLIFADDQLPQIDKPGYPSSKLPIRKILPKEAGKITPQAIILGSFRIEVSSWNDCLPKYEEFVHKSITRGESLDLTVPANFLSLDASSCLETLKALISASKLDLFSVYLECGSSTGASRIEPKSEVKAKAQHRTDADSSRPGAAASDDTSPTDQKLIVTRVHHRHFHPDVYVW